MNASPTPARTVGPALTLLEALCAPADLDIVGQPVKQTLMTVLQVSDHINWHTKLLRLSITVKQYNRSIYIYSI